MGSATADKAAQDYIEYLLSENRRPRELLPV